MILVLFSSGKRSGSLACNLGVGGFGVHHHNPGVAVSQYSTVAVGEAMLGITMTGMASGSLSAANDADGTARDGVDDRAAAIAVMAGGTSFSHLTSFAISAACSALC